MYSPIGYQLNNNLSLTPMIDRTHISLWMRMAVAVGLLFVFITSILLVAGVLLLTAPLVLFGFLWYWLVSTVAAGAEALGVSGVVVTGAVVLVTLAAGTLALYTAVCVMKLLPTHVRELLRGHDAMAAVQDIETTTIQNLGDTVEIASGKVIDVRELETRVQRLAQQADVPPPAVAITYSWTPTAVTVGYRPEECTVVFSTGLLDAVDGDELDAVIAHELAHVKHRDTMVMTGLTVCVAIATEVVDWLGGTFFAIIGTIALGLSKWCVAVVARCRELAADDGAVAITGNPAALASALESLDRELRIRPVADLRESDTTAALSIVPPPREEWSSLDRIGHFLERQVFGTHPPTEMRIERLLEER